MPKPKDPELYARLKRESKTPYRGLRLFVYLALGGSGFIGAVVFFAKLIAGNGDIESNLANLALQLGAIALMLWLYRIDRDSV
jgi:divalent metal cation (Fe/Co/Zn/Cd) transporter